MDQLMKESIWKDDRAVLECQNCKKAFSVVVRKVRNSTLGVVSKTRNGMERNGLFHSVLFRILLPEAIL